MYYFMVGSAFLVHSKLGPLCADNEDSAGEIHAHLKGAFALFESAESGFGVSVQIVYEDEERTALGGCVLLPAYADTSMILPDLVEEDFDRMSRPMWD